MLKRIQDSGRITSGPLYILHRRPEVLAFANSARVDPAMIPRVVHRGTNIGQTDPMDAAVNR